MKTYLINLTCHGNTMMWEERDYMDYDLWSEFRVDYSERFDKKTRHDFMAWLFQNGVKRIPPFNLYLTLRGSQYQESVSKIETVELRAVNKAEYQMLPPEETDKLVATYHLPADFNDLFGKYMKEVHGLPLRCEADMIEKFMEKYPTIFTNYTITTIETYP